MIAAFFDIDGTIFRNSLLTEHFKKLIKYDSSISGSIYYLYTLQKISI